ncbi:MULTISPECIES: hypothetical protein [Micromonospora]|uniref:META domain-containing protein n=1 Tax=Micromonospora yangpuensis TaxID=683228 RepID=A0A1C6VFP3_9ACTN|nr:hypothetical protein [Micromonospora yangpuensis]GGM31189.1 hypothetical protein GCM10012279_57610 [Micromonospora yangpuensis]SCL65173.1 hypothetical protein GA0070617_5684 [Micromonospora yangpuensis]
MRGRGYVVGMLAVGLLLSGCAGRTDGQDAPGDSTVGWDVGEPTGLIGSWTVTGLDGAEPILRLAPDDLSVFEDCGVRLGQWRAHPDGLFVASVSGGLATSRSAGGECAGETETPDWLARVTGFRTDGDQRVLLDEQDQQVARLRPGARPSAPPEMSAEQAAPPVVTDQARRDLGPVKELPAALTAPARDAVLGRWAPADGARGGPRAAHVELRADGDWRGSDGCNGQGGRWVLGSGGAFLASSGPSTLIGCDNVPVGSWLDGARRIGLDGAVLVLFDAQGAETARLHRAS